MPGNKVVSLKQIKNISAKLKKAGKKIVFTNGCFDILHCGHVQYLEEARKKGDYLIVGLNSDSSVKKIKGKDRPIVSQADRAIVIAGLASVNYVVIFNEDTPSKVIKIIRPDILIKGADWAKNNIVGADFVKGYGGKVSTIKLVDNRSTTNIIKKIVKTCCCNQ